MVDEAITRNTGYGLCKTCTVYEKHVTHLITCFHSVHSPSIPCGYMTPECRKLDSQTPCEYIISYGTLFSFFIAKIGLLSLTLEYCVLCLYFLYRCSPLLLGLRCMFVCRSIVWLSFIVTFLCPQITNNRIINKQNNKNRNGMEVEWERWNDSILVGCPPRLIVDFIHEMRATFGAGAAFDDLYIFLLVLNFLFFVLSEKQRSINCYHVRVDLSAPQQIKHISTSTWHNDLKYPYAHKCQQKYSKTEKFSIKPNMDLLTD